MNLLLLLVAALLVSSAAGLPSPSVVTDRSKPCRAIALAGGGDRGAYQAGVFKAFVENVPEEVKYDVVTGISAGSINTAALCMYKIGEEKAASDFMSNEWLSIEANNIYKNWPLGPIEGFFDKSGLFDTSPLAKYLETKVNSSKVISSGRDCIVGATSLTRDVYVQFQQDNPNFITALRASSAVPGVFPVVHIGEDALVDGGAEYLTPVTDALGKCNLVSDNISIDVILCIGFVLPEANHTWITPEVLLRTLTLQAQNTLMKNAQTASVAFPNAKIRVVYPSKSLPGYFLTFNPKYAEEMIKIGYEDGIKALQSEGKLPQDFVVELKL